MNLTPVFEGIKRDLDRWMPLPISLLGRIAIIKMNVLPRLLYQMQMLPNFIPVNFFKSLHALISDFIWQRKRARFKLQKLQLPIQKGGLALPNFLYYHMASQVRYIVDWIKNDPNSTYLDLEAFGCNPVSISDLIFIKNVDALPGLKENLIVKNTLKTWNRIRKHYGITNRISCLAPVVNNPDFVHSCHDVGFRAWKDAGISTIKNLYKEGVLKSFQQLKTEFNLHQSQFFRYLQLRSYINSIPEFRTGLCTAPNQVESILIKASTLPKKTVSFLYDSLFQVEKASTNNSKIAWENHFQTQIDEGLWGNILLNAKKITCSNKSYETQYKIVHRLHISPVIRSKFDPLCSPLCPRCQNGQGTHSHMMWSCPLIRPFWVSIQDEIMKLTGVSIPLDPIHYILGADINIILSKSTQSLLRALLYAARLSILHKWVEDSPPTVLLWFEKVFRLMPLERLSYVLRGNLEDFVEVWLPLAPHMGTEWSNVMCVGLTDETG